MRMKIRTTLRVFLNLERLSTFILWRAVSAGCSWRQSQIYCAGRHWRNRTSTRAVAITDIENRRLQALRLRTCYQVQATYTTGRQSASDCLFSLALLILKSWAMNGAKCHIYPTCLPNPCLQSFRAPITAFRDAGDSIHGRPFLVLSLWAATGSTVLQHPSHRPAPVPVLSQAVQTENCHLDN